MTGLLLIARSLRRVVRSSWIERTSSRWWRWHKRISFGKTSRRLVQRPSARWPSIAQHRRTRDPGLEIVHTAEFERGTALCATRWTEPNHAGWMHFASSLEHFHKGEYEQALSARIVWTYQDSSGPTRNGVACGHLDRRVEAQARSGSVGLDPSLRRTCGQRGSWHFASGLMDPIWKDFAQRRNGNFDGMKQQHRRLTALVITAARAPRARRKVFWVAVLPFKYGGRQRRFHGPGRGDSEDVLTGLSVFLPAGHRA